MQKSLRKADIAPYIGLIPSLAMFSIFILYPTFMNFYFALTEYNGVTTAKFIGMSNFIRAFGEGLLLNAIKNSFTYAILITVIQNCIAVTLAIFLSLKIRGADFFRSLYFFPNVMGAFAVAVIWGILMDPNFGSFSHLLKTVGLNITFFGTAKSIFTIIFIQIWISFGYAMTIYYTNIMSIPRELFEASEIDGAGFLSNIRNIVLPLIAPSITINILLSIIGSLKLFDIIYITTQGGPANSTENLPVLIFNQAFSQGEHGYGAALNVVQFLIISGMALLITRLRKRNEADM